MKMVTGWLVVLLCAPMASGQTVEGKFDRALALEKTTAHAPDNPIYAVMPLTVECWVKLPAELAENQILLANEIKTSGTHWAILVEKGTGKLCACTVAGKPHEIKSEARIADGRWHYVAMTREEESIKLYVDGNQVLDQKVEKHFFYSDTSPMTFGYNEEVAGQKGAVLDEVRISRGIRKIEGVPAEPFRSDRDTIALWHFDEPGTAKVFRDFSRTNNAVKLAERGAWAGISSNNNRWQAMEFGPFFSATFSLPYPGKNVTPKGVAVRLGQGRDAAVLFDTEMMRPSAAWTGEFIKLTPGREGLASHPTIPGAFAWGTIAGPGWGASAQFADPRPGQMGILPKDQAKYHGLYVHGERVVFSYSIGATKVLESCDLEANGEGRAFVRTLEVGPTGGPLYLRIADLPGAKGVVEMSLEANHPGTARLDKDGNTVAAMLVGLVDGGWEVSDGRIALKLNASAAPRRLKLLLWGGPSGAMGSFSGMYQTSGGPAALEPLTRGGPARYPQKLETRGVLGKGDGPYVVDTLTAPEENPWKSFLRFGGHDFFKNGDMAVCSVSGDVWVVSGVDAKLEKLSWKRYATGLHQPLGLKIVDEKVYVLGRDQITRLHDLNGDGEADYYENFNNDAYVTTNGHAYATNLDTDPEGNFYYTVCGDGTPTGGCLLKVAKDGSKLEVFATGLRNPNGMGVSPSGVVTAADNQGDWVPASRIDIAKRGSFLGYQPMSKMKPPPTHAGRPLCWMPQNVDNSSGGQCWVTSDKWGPFKGKMLHTSYGAASLLLVLEEEVNGQAQGGVYRFSLSFATGIMRGRFSPVDGQLYVSGMRGWQTAGSKSGALQRVRYTGKPVRMPAELNVHKNGVKLTFTCELDPGVAADKDAYTVLVWNYRWTGNYGSRHYSVQDPQKQGYDTLEIKSVKVSEDKRSVFLEIPEIKPVMQMQIGYGIDAADGTIVKGDVFSTIHELQPEK